MKKQLISVSKMCLEGGNVMEDIEKMPIEVVTDPADGSLAESYGLSVKKSNAFVSAKYKSTLLENKILAVALTRLEICGDSISAKLYPGELRQLLGMEEDTNIYRKLKRISKTMLGHSVTLEDGKGNFQAFNMIPNVYYESGVLEIIFNKDLKPHIYQLTGNYTKYSLATLVNFDTNSAFRIYELLRKELYRLQFSPEGCVKKDYDIYEFRFMIATVNTDEEAVRRAIAGGKTWEEIYEKIAIEKQYRSWGDLKTRVIIPAQKELKEKSDIRFEFRGIRLGVGGKTRRIEFTIWSNEVAADVKRGISEKADKVERINQEYQQMTFSDVAYEGLYRKYVGHNSLSKEDIGIMLQAAGYEAEKVGHAIEMADKQEHLNNYIGWIISCIKRGYEEPIETINGSAERAQRVKNLMEKAHTPEVAERAWERARQSEEYPVFMEYLRGQQMEEIFEYGYDTEEKFQIFIDWKKNR